MLLVTMYLGNLYLMELKFSRYHKFIYDQLTVARIRGAATLRSSDLNEEKQLKGFVEVVSDWHTRLCLVTVCT